MSEVQSADTARTFSVNRLTQPEPAVFLHCAIFVNRNTILSAETFRNTGEPHSPVGNEPFDPPERDDCDAPTFVSG